LIFCGILKGGNSFILFEFPNEVIAVIESASDGDFRHGVTVKIQKGFRFLKTFEFDISGNTDSRAVGKSSGKVAFAHGMAGCQIFQTQIFLQMIGDIFGSFLNDSFVFVQNRGGGACLFPTQKNR